MNKNFVLRSGKFQGKTIEWLEDNESSYLFWIKENRPEMLKGSEDPKPVEKRQINSSDISTKSIVPNLNFWNEGPDDMSKPYIKKMQENER